MAGSTWWPTPANPSKWFSAEQLANSRAYHQPWDTMKHSTAATVVALLAVLTWWANWAEIGIWVYLLTVLAVVAPLAGYFWWFNAHHAPSLGAGKSPIQPMLVGALWIGAIIISVSGATLALLELLSSSGSRLLALVLASLAVSWIVLRGPWIDDHHREMAHEDQPAFCAVAEWVGVKCKFVLEKSPVLDGPNARAERGRRQDFVVVSPALLHETAELQSLVVAHEVWHIKHGHHRKIQLLAVARALSWAVGMWVVFTVTGARFEASANFPLWVIVSALAFAPPMLAMSFVVRHFERRADIDSYELLGSVPTSLARELYARRLTDLDPGLMSRAFSLHPPPAERLEVVARRIQSL